MFALVDCNNFYASCERLFRPDLNHTPIVVLSNNDGCIIARSAEAKAAGIKMGVPFHQCRSELELKGVRWFSSNYALYGDISSRIMAVLEEKAPRVEIYSIDEAFLDITGFGGYIGLEEYGSEVRETVYRWTGIRVGVGIAPTKTLAKLANYIAKKNSVCDGVVVLDSQSSICEALENIDVANVWGVGRKVSNQLKVEGIQTALQLSNADPSWLKRRFNILLEKTARELRGQPCFSLEEDVQPRQQIVSSRSFGNRVSDLKNLQASISHHVMRAGEKLRQDKLKAGDIQVFIRTGLFNPSEPKYSGNISYRFVEPTADTRKLASIANRLLKQVWRPGYRYVKAGIMLSDLKGHSIIQRDLFTNDISPKDYQLMVAVDELNKRFPSGVKLGRSLLVHGEANLWKMNRRYLSPSYTTQWKALPVVR